MIFRVATSVFEDTMLLLIGELGADGRVASYAAPVVLTFVERQPQKVCEPTFKFTSQEASNLMTAMWEAGVRPAGYGDTRGEIMRMQAHIDDLRKMVFK